MMAERHIGSAIVTKNDRLVGIVAVTDACRALAQVLGENEEESDRVARRGERHGARRQAAISQRSQPSPPTSRLVAAVGLSGGSAGCAAVPSQPILIQSSPQSSTGCCARSVPLPQRMSSAGQKRSHPQQMRSG